MPQCEHMTSKGHQCNNHKIIHMRHINDNINYCRRHQHQIGGLMIDPTKPLPMPKPKPLPMSKTKPLSKVMIGKCGCLIRDTNIFGNWIQKRCNNVCEIHDSKGKDCVCEQHKYSCHWYKQ